MAKKRTWTDADLREAVRTSASWAQVLRKLGLKPGGGAQANIVQHAKRLKCATRHMTGQGWCKRWSHLSKPIEHWLRQRKKINSHELKKRLWKVKLLPQECQSCGLKEWLGQPAPLELDHKDGDRANNALQNLRILCPNCHALTPTHGTKNLVHRRARPGGGMQTQQVESLPRVINPS